MKKPVQKIGTFILVGFLIIWLFVSVIPFNGDKTKVIENKAKKEVYEPPFTHEANLSIFNQRDSLISQVRIELADNDQEISYGMMYRKKLDDDAGMLFMMPDEIERSFWMKNTYIPLDIIFVNSKDEIVSIQTHAKPLTETPIPSGLPASQVLEVNAGFSDRFGLEEGYYVKLEKL
jgi:uncharacterized membrane protein (UPF0127 family)